MISNPHFYDVDSTPGSDRSRNAGIFLSWDGGRFGRIGRNFFCGFETM